MNVTILGATGAIGREITSQLIRSRVLSRMEILQLATNPQNPASRLCADGIRRDLQDAYAEINPELQVVEKPEEFIGDIVVVAGGRTLPTNDFKGSRRDLVPFAKEMCDTYAGALVDSVKVLLFVGVLFACIAGIVVVAGGGAFGGAGAALRW